VGRPAGELEPHVEVFEEARVAEGAEELATVEFGQGLEEDAEGREFGA
jgi:hypothetical protein